MKFLRFLLFPFSFLYRIITGVRNWLFNKNILKSSKFDFPIICIGNLSMGGTGKTPHIEYLIRLLQDEFKTATLSRGYGRKTNYYELADEKSNAEILGDEPYQYHRKFPKIKVAVEKKRVLGAIFLLEDNPDLEVILLDDAFQHRALRAGLNILISDYNNLYYDDYILPVGELRETRKGAERADIIIISKCPANITESEQIKIQGNIKNGASVFFSMVNYGTIYNAYTNQNIEDKLTEYEIILVTGIAKPKPIENYLDTLKAKYKVIHFGDHYRFKSKDIDTISKIFDTFTSPKKIVLTTEKDFSRMAHLKGFENLPIHCLPIEISFLGRKEEFDKKVLKYVRENKTNIELPKGEI